MSRLRIFIKIIGLLLAAYLLLRLVFIITYSPGGIGVLATDPAILYWGLRLDLTAIIIINLPFAIFYLFIAPSLSHRAGTKIAKWLFIPVNLAFLAINTIDLAYYHFNSRRSTIDLVYAFTESLGSFAGLFARYWFMVVLFIIAAYLFIRISGQLLKNAFPLRDRKLTYYVTAVSMLLFVMLMARGLGSRPIGPSTPLLYFHPSLQPAVNNSTLNFLYSAFRFKTKLERKSFFSPAALDSTFSIRRQYVQLKPMMKKNVVIFLLESMNESFFQPGPGRAYTPFLDSIRAVSTVCVNAYQNGHESVKGALATLASLPPFTEEPMFISNYSSVPFNGIGTLLERQGYTTNFFLGAEHDHFNFAKLCRMTGIRNYYSRDDVDMPFEDDGHWGIYDEYFFDFFSRKSATVAQPFLSVLYNISTHPPFSIPPSRKKEFSIDGQDEQKNSVSYMDDCFRRLFGRIGGEAWFGNTVFLFIADHSLPPYTEERSALYSSLRIPFFIHDPAAPIGRSINRTVQQLDLVPTVMDLLHYPKPFMSFGNSVYDSAYGFSVSRINGALQLVDDSTLTGMDESANRLLYHYNLHNDPRLQNNRAQSNHAPAFQQTRMLQAILQRFNNSILDNNLEVK